MGVAETFQAFRSAYLLGKDQMDSISYRYKRITRQLNTDFWETQSDTAHSLYIGSYGRDTAARGVSDVDIWFTLPNRVYHQYNNYNGNGQSA
jgi:tRNA nucleotidyltransferase (CCA-adding enzyme)